MIYCDTNFVLRYDINSLHIAISIYRYIATPLISIYGPHTDFGLCVPCDFDLRDMTFGQVMTHPWIKDNNCVKYYPDQTRRQKLWPRQDVNRQTGSFLYTLPNFNCVCVWGGGGYKYSKIVAMFHLEIYLHFHPEVTSTVIGKNFFQWAIFNFFYESIVIFSRGNFFIVYTDFDGPFSKLL